MKTMLSALFVLLANFMSVFGQEYLVIQDPDRTWNYINGSITQAEYILRPGKNFVTCDLYLTYECKYSGFQNNIQYELIHNFSLPENLIITDSWLWVDSVIMKADILERNEAINIYEGIVNRRRDPSLLLKNSATSYNFKIYPIFNNKTRRVKLRFEIPIDIQKHDRTVSIPTGLLLSAQPRPDVTIKVIDDENYDLTLENGLPLELVNDEKLGIIYQAVIPATTSAVNLKIKSEDAKPKLSYVVENEAGTPYGLYQISLHPTKVFEFITQANRNVIVLIEHDSVYSNLSKQDVLTAASEFVKTYLQKGDSLQILYNSTGVKKHYPDFIPFESLTTSVPVTSIKPGNFSTIPASLFEAYELLQNRINPVLVLVSSASNVTTTALALCIKNELESVNGTLLKTFVLSYVNDKAPGISYAGQYFLGNNLLNVTMTSNSAGYLHITPTTVRNLDNFRFHLNIFGQQFDLLTQKPVEFQYSLKPIDGLTYDNLTIKDDANGWMQIGRFTGTPPFLLDAVTWIDNQVSQHIITLDSVQKSDQIDTYRRIHQGFKILSMENDNLSENKLNIINASLEHRVLSRFTAFLALEPGMQDPCPDCVDESTTAVDDIAESVSWKVYPNPFSDKVIIELSGLESNEKPEEVTLYNIRGEKQHAEVYISGEKNTWTIEIHGQFLPAGMYIIKVRVGNRILTCKVVKI